jgi:hypothetical protein
VELGSVPAAAASFFDCRQFVDVVNSAPEQFRSGIDEIENYRVGTLAAPWEMLVFSDQNLLG